MTTTIEGFTGEFEVKCEGRTVTTLYTNCKGETQVVYEESFGSEKRAAKVYEQEIRAVKRANKF